MMCVVTDDIPTMRMNGEEENNQINKKVSKSIEKGNPKMEVIDKT